MALVLKDRVKVTSGSTGTGVFTLGAAVLGFQDFAAIGDGNTTYYTIALQSGDEWEVGVGTVVDTGGGAYTLNRNTVLESSNAGSLVNFSAGTKDVFVTYPAERAVYLNGAGTEVEQEDFDNITANSISLTTGSITTVPVAATDIPNKLYVDEVAEGLKAKPAAELATTASLDATYNNGTAGVGATLTANSNGAFPTIDGVTLSSTALGVNGVLVKNQTNSAHNGRYNLTTVGDGSTPWVLTRCPLCDEASEIPGAYVFVKAGTLNGNTGWVQTVLNPSTFVVGTDAIIVVQFFGAGTYTAGTGLTLTGTEFSITNTGTAGTYGTASQVPVFTTNAQGQVTAATPTAIAIAASAVSGLAASATTDTTNAANITAGTLPVARLNGSYTGITGVGTLTAGTWNATTIAPNHGGTGLASYTVGDIIFANGTTSLARLAGVATGNVLISGGVGTAPLYGKVGLTTHVSGTLPIGNGGTGQTTAGAAINALLPAQTSQSGNYLTTNGTNPSWAAIPAPNNGTLTMNVSGTGLSGSATFTANQAGGSTFTVTSNATSVNTNGAIVARDGSGNFSAGTITAALSGNATTATTLQTARTIGGVSFNGSANINLPGVNTAGNQNTTGNAATATTLQTARTINGVSFNGSANITITAASPQALTIGTGLSGTSYNGSSAVTIAIDSTVATLTGSQVLTNKTVTDSTFFIQDDLDNTKKAQFQVSDVSAGTTRTYTLPNVTAALATVGNLAQTFSGTTTFSAATVTVGTATAGATYGVGTGATTTGNTKTVNLGTSGASGSTTAMNFGSATSGAISTFTFNGTTSVKLPAGTTAQRNGTPTAGMLRFNSETGQFEGYNGTAWGAIGGGASGGGSDAIFYENDQTVTANYTITTNKNAMTAGPVTINNSITVTVPNGSTWTIV